MFASPLILYAIVKTLFFSPFLVEGESMMPTLQNGELFLVDRLSYQKIEPKRDDVVVFSLDEDPGYFYVKRIIGLPGDQIHLEKDGVYVLDSVTGRRKKLSEPFIMPEKFRSEHFLSLDNELGQDFTVPEGRYFVLGDNREHSKDSRFFKEPFIPREHIIGKFGLEL